MQQHAALTLISSSTSFCTSSRPAAAEARQLQLQLTQAAGELAACILSSDHQTRQAAKAAKKQMSHRSGRSECQVSTCTHIVLLSCCV